MPSSGSSNAKKLEGMRRRGESERRSDAGERDLRPLIEDVEVLDVDEKAHTATLRTVLQLDANGAGRPEDVVARAGPAAAGRPGRPDAPPLR